MGERRQVPAVVPAGPARHRPVVLQRRGALSFPVQVRPAAVADDGWVFVVADVAQLEPRVLAGMSGDRALARSARGTDLYQGMVDDGAVASRNDAARPARRDVRRHQRRERPHGRRRRYPDAFGLVEQAARAGERGEVVRTLLGRGSPTLGDAWDRDPDDLPADPDSLARHRRAYGRFTRNFIAGHGRRVGAVLDRRPAQPALAPARDRPPRLPTAPGLLPPRRGRRPHPAALADDVAAQATEAAATAAGLLFRDSPSTLPLNVSIVRSYADAGKPGAAVEVVTAPQH